MLYDAIERVAEATHEVVLIAIGRATQSTSSGLFARVRTPSRAHTLGWPRGNSLLGGRGWNA
jgi:hypothetical protein